MTTIRKVAEKAGVSIATVSRVINGSTAVAPELRDRVFAAVSGCGYSPTVGRRSADSIALVYTGPLSVGSPYDAACFEGIVSSLLENDLDLKITNLSRDKKSTETYSQFFFRKDVRGVILRTTMGDRDIARAIADEGFPAVVLGDHFDHPTLSFAYNDSRAASAEGVKYLVSLGHQRVAFAANDTEDGDHIDRLQAYRQTLKSHNLYDEQLEFRVPAHRMDGAQLMRRMMSLTVPPTAVYIADPLIAVGAINEAHRLGLKVPEELSVLGFDDTDTRYTVFPTMTAVCQDTCTLGRSAYDLLVRQCNSQLPAKDRVFLGKAWLEINHSAGSAPTRSIRVLPNGERLVAAAGAASLVS